MVGSHSAPMLKVLRGKGRWLFALALGSAALVRIAVLFLIAPGSDVFYYDRQVAEVLLNLQNPYTHHFTGIPTALSTPGAENVFAYLPFTAIYLVPFYFAGDIRLGFIAADLLVAVVLYLLSDEKMNTPLFFLFVPFTVLFATVYVNNALISILFLALFILSEKRGRPLLGAICFGIALSAIQFSWLLLPFVLSYYLRRRSWREATLSMVVVAVVILPFLIASPMDFYGDVVSFQFTRSTLGLFSGAGPLGYNLNLSLNSLLLALLKTTLPGWLRLLLAAAILPFFMLRLRGLETFLKRACVYVFAAIFILPTDLFWSYTELPLVIFLAYVSVARYGPRAAARIANDHEGGSRTGARLRIKT